MMSAACRQNQGLRAISHRRTATIGPAILGLAIWLVLGGGVPTEAASPLRERLDVGFIRSAFEGLRFEDAEAAFKTFARTLGKQKGYDVDVTVRALARSASADKSAASAPLKRPQQGE